MTKVLADFHICISVPLKLNTRELVQKGFICYNTWQLTTRLVFQRCCKHEGWGGAPQNLMGGGSLSQNMGGAWGDLKKCHQKIPVKEFIR